GISHAADHDLFLGHGHGLAQAVLHGIAGPRRQHDRSLRLPRPHLIFRLLGADAAAELLPHQALGTGAAEPLCGFEIRSLHADGIGADAGRPGLAELEFPCRRSPAWDATLVFIRSRGTAERTGAA